VIDRMYEWLFDKSTYYAIDMGGAYRRKNNTKDASKYPNFTPDYAKKFGIDLTLVKDTYRATAHPQFIRNLVQDFLSKHNMHPGKYLGIHFRYNFNDFIKGNSDSEAAKIGSAYRANSVEGLASIVLSVKDPNYLYKHLKSYLDSLPPHFDRVIYLATPVVMWQWFREQHFGVVDPEGSLVYKGITIVSGYEQSRFLKTYIDNCETIKTYFGEIESIFDKEVMVNSGAFIRSRPSNWSFNVMGHRMAANEDLPYDRTIYDIFYKKNGELPSVEDIAKMGYPKEWFTKHHQKNKSLFS